MVTAPNGANYYSVPSSEFQKNLLESRAAGGNVLPGTVDDLPQWALTGVTSVSPTIAVALAGVESENQHFSNQVGLIEEFLRPAGWETSGNTVLVQFPELIAFVYQGLTYGSVGDAESAGESGRAAC